MRIAISFKCKECKNKNYFSSKSKTTSKGKLELKKYCKFCKSHTLHKESKIK